MFQWRESRESAVIFGVGTEVAEDDNLRYKEGAECEAGRGGSRDTREFSRGRFGFVRLRKSQSSLQTKTVEGELSPTVGGTDAIKEW